MFWCVLGRHFRKPLVHEPVDRRSIKINTIRQARGLGAFGLACFVLLRQVFGVVKSYCCSRDRGDKKTTWWEGCWSEQELEDASEREQEAQAVRSLECGLGGLGGLGGLAAARCVSTCRAPAMPPVAGAVPNAFCAKQQLYKPLSLPRVSISVSARDKLCCALLDPNCAIVPM